MADKIIYIPLTDGYAWSLDNLGNYTLIHKETREVKELGNGGKGTGKFKEYTDVLGYYSSLTGLLKAVVKDAAYRGIESGEVQTLQDYIDKLSDMEEKINNISHGF